MAGAARPPGSSTRVGRAPTGRDRWPGGNGRKSNASSTPASTSLLKREHGRSAHRIRQLRARAPGRCRWPVRCSSAASTNAASAATVEQTKTSCAAAPSGAGPLGRSCDRDSRGRRGPDHRRGSSRRGGMLAISPLDSIVEELIPMMLSHAVRADDPLVPTLLDATLARICDGPAAPRPDRFANSPPAPDHDAGLTYRRSNPVVAVAVGLYDIVRRPRRSPRRPSFASRSLPFFYLSNPHCPPPSPER